MSELPTHRSHATAWALVVVSVLVLYVLSIGPLVYFQEKGMIAKPSPSWVENFYAPMDWLYENTPLSEPLKAYERWCWDMAHKP